VHERRRVRGAWGARVRRAACEHQPVGGDRSSPGRDEQHDRHRAGRLECGAQGGAPRRA
jgi:hypothetical protein